MVLHLDAYRASHDRARGEAVKVVFKADKPSMENRFDMFEADLDVIPRQGDFFALHDRAGTGFMLKVVSVTWCLNPHGSSALHRVEVDLGWS